MKAKIIYEDNDIVVCHKPAGLATQSGKAGEADMESELKNYLQSPYIGLVHRLDQPVEGILVFGKTPQATKELNRQITDGTMRKFYYAILNGIPRQKEAVLVNYLVKDSRTNMSRVTGSDEKGAKYAELSYTVVKELADTALVEIDLVTGRHHQIRVQMAHNGMPLLGDRKYTKGGVLRRANSPESDNVALLAHKIEFIHPKKKGKMSFHIQSEQAVFDPYIGN